MGSEMETAFREFLLDPDYWKPRLKDLSKAPRELAMFPRPDLARSTLDVTELGMLAHDGSRLRGLLVRPARRVRGEDIDLVASEFLGADAVPWKRAEGGVCVLVYELGKGRRLEDRVLDLLRFASTACALETARSHSLRFHNPQGAAPADEARIVERIRDRGWMEML
ncbi:MAG: hypothetical protein ACI82F_004551 [Planctomycetota bacterium]|jgi:hypothetical protein